MPCRVDPSPGEIEQYRYEAEQTVRVNSILKWAKEAFSDLNIDWKTSDKSYVGISKMLCDRFRTMEHSNIVAFEAKIYDGRDRGARDAATWWEDHKENDARNEANVIARARNLAERGTHKNCGAMGILVELLDKDPQPGGRNWYRVYNALEAMLNGR